MIVIYSLLLLIVTAIGGSVPLWWRRWTDENMKGLLTFSGGFLLSLALVHLIPEAFHHGAVEYAGLLLLAGFLFQFLIQRLTHGMEHGHIHHHTGVSTFPITIGLAIHAFLEGIPLAVFSTEEHGALTLFVAIAVHKIPETMLITSLYYSQTKKISKTLFVLLAFSAITPFAAIMSHQLQLQIGDISNILGYSIPFIAGAFIQISTTIFLEAQGKMHNLKSKSWIYLLLGLALGAISLHSH